MLSIGQGWPQRLQEGPELVRYWLPLWSVLIWSGNTVVTKAAVGRHLAWFDVLIPVAAGISGAVAVGGAATFRQRAIVFDYWLKLATFYQSLTYEAAKTTSATNIGVIVALMPLFSTVLAACSHRKGCRSSA